jgi:hypothetical protein
MHKTYRLHLRDVFGGDGEVRHITLEEPRVTRTRSTTTKRLDTKVATESGYEELQLEKSLKEVATFRKDAEGRPMLRLGGSHGKLWGSLKSARGILFNAMGDGRFKSPRILDAIQISPVWVSLELNGFESRLETLPQLLAGMGNRQIIQHFDVLPEATATITIICPDALETHLTVMLEQLKTMSVFNKRRATITAIEEL